jgi:hypothetical protein
MLSVTDEFLQRTPNHDPASKKKKTEKTKVDQEFRRIAEETLRRDRELLERLAKI